jgi:hypothetical protein
VDSNLPGQGLQREKTWKNEFVVALNDAKWPERL